MELITTRTSKCENTEKGRIKSVIMAGNGIFEERSSWLGTSVKRVNDYRVPSYPKLEESLELKDEAFPRIPQKAVEYVINWYRAETSRTGNEAQVNFYKYEGDISELRVEVGGKPHYLKNIDGINFWSKNIFSYVPLQNNHQASTSVADEDEFYDELNKHYGIYVETHSHNSMEAFRSGTDEEYSGNDGIQFVFGKLNTNKPEMYAWATVREVQRAGLSAEEILKFVELPKHRYTKDNKVEFLHIEKRAPIRVRKGWTDRVVVKPQVVKSYSNGAIWHDYDSKQIIIGEDVLNKKWEIPQQYPMFQSVEQKVLSAIKIAEARFAEVIEDEGLCLYIHDEMLDWICDAFEVGVMSSGYTNKTAEQLSEGLLRLMLKFAEASRDGITNMTIE